MQKLAFLSFAGIVALLLVFSLQEPAVKKTSGKKESIATTYMHTASLASPAQADGHKN
jgi:hypothetical protein